MKQICASIMLLLAAVGVVFAHTAGDIQLQRAQNTMYAIGQQLSRYYTAHKHLPPASFNDKFSMIGMDTPPSRYWDYSFRCVKQVCQVVAERVEPLRPREGELKRMLSLRLTVNKNRPASFARVESRVVWSIQRGGVPFVWEKTLPADDELCTQVSGQWTDAGECALPLKITPAK